MHRPVCMRNPSSLGHILHDELHWLDVPDRVFQAGSDCSPMSERLCTTVPVGLCAPVAGADSRRHLRSANRQLLAVGLPLYRLNTYGRRAFSVVGPIVWNSPGFHPEPDHQCRLFQTFAQNVFVRLILVHSAR